MFRDHKPGPPALEEQ